MFPSPKELDVQSKIQLDGWVDLDSERWRETDNDPSLTKKWLRMLMQEPAYLFTDADGRVWGKGEDGHYYPYHYEYGKKKYGIRLPKKAAN
jgi:hypothetical protein